MKNLVLLLSCTTARVIYRTNAVNSLPIAQVAQCPENQEWKTGKRPEMNCGTLMENTQVNMMAQAEASLLSMVGSMKEEATGCFCKPGFVRVSSDENSPCITAETRVCEAYRQQQEMESKDSAQVKQDNMVKGYLMMDALADDNVKSDDEMKRMILANAFSDPAMGNTGMQKLILAKEVAKGTDNLDNMIVAGVVNPSAQGVQKYVLMDEVTKKSDGTSHDKLDLIMASSEGLDQGTRSYILAEELAKGTTFSNDENLKNMMMVQAAGTGHAGAAEGVQKHFLAKELIKKEDSNYPKSESDKATDFLIGQQILNPGSANNAFTNYIMIDSANIKESGSTKNLLLAQSMNDGNTNGLQTYLMVDALKSDSTSSTTSDNDSLKKLMLVQAIGNQDGTGNGLQQYMLVDAITDDSSSSSDKTKKLLLVNAMNGQQSEKGLFGGNGLQTYILVDALTDDSSSTGSSSTTSSTDDSLKKLMLVQAMNNQDGTGNGLQQYILVDALTDDSSSTGSDSTKKLLLLSAMNGQQEENGILGGNGLQQYIMVDALTDDSSSTGSDSTKTLLLLGAMNGQQGENVFGGNGLQTYMLVDALSEDSSLTSSTTSDNDSLKKLMLVQAMGTQDGTNNGFQQYILVDALTGDSSSTSNDDSLKNLMLVNAMSGQGEQDPSSNLKQYVLVQALNDDGTKKDTTQQLMLLGALNPDANQKNLQQYVMLDKLTDKDSKTSTTDILLMNQINQADSTDGMKNYLMMDKVLNSDGTSKTSDYLLLNQMQQKQAPGAPDHVKNYLILDKVGAEKGFQTTDFILMKELSPKEGRNTMQDYVVLDQLTDGTSDSAAKNYMLMNTLQDPKGTDGQGLSNYLIMDKVIPGDSVVKDAVLLGQMGGNPVPNMLLMDKINQGNVASAPATTTNLANDYLMMSSVKHPRQGNPMMGYLAMDQMTAAEKTQATNYVMLDTLNNPNSNRGPINNYVIMDKVLGTEQKDTAQDFLLASQLSG